MSSGKQTKHSAREGKKVDKCLAKEHGYPRPISCGELATVAYDADKWSMGTLIVGLSVSCGLTGVVAVILNTQKGNHSPLLSLQTKTITALSVKGPACRI